MPDLEARPPMPWWVRSKRNFVWFSVATVGVFSAGMLLWYLHSLIAEPLWYVFLAADGLFGGFLWGLVMWHLFVLPGTATLRATSPNNTLHADARDTQATAGDIGARADGRER